MSLLLYLWLKILWTGAWLIILQGFLETYALSAFYIHSSLVPFHYKCFFILWFSVRADLVSLPLSMLSNNDCGLSGSKGKGCHIF